MSSDSAGYSFFCCGIAPTLSGFRAQGIMQVIILAKLFSVTKVNTKFVGDQPFMQPDLRFVELLRLDRGKVF